MFRSLFKRVREISLINSPIRFIIRTGSTLFYKLQERWPVSGIISFDYSGTKIKAYNRCDDGFVHFFYYGKEYHESNVLTLTDAFAKKGITILDIGANTGLDAIIIAKKNPGIKVIAIEPFEPNYKRFEQNIELNNVSNIDVKKVAIGDENGTIEFTVPRDGRISDVASGMDDVGRKVYPELEWKKVKVEQKTLDSLDLPPIKFFKCDVEGFEMNVLKGAGNFIKKNLPTFIVEIAFVNEKEKQQKIDFFNQFAKDYGYCIYCLNENGLVKLDQFYEIDWRGDYLFSRYVHLHNFIPSKDLPHFVQLAHS